jgi:hypothetical protein
VEGGHKMAWQTPKTNWQAADVVSKDDFNRIEGNAQHLKDAKADKTEFNLHVNNKNNPHNVTASQVGAATPAQLAAKVDKPSSATSGNIAVFDGGAGKLKDGGKKVTDFVSSNVVSGYVEYSDYITAENTLTKTIALGGNYKYGKAIINENYPTLGLNGIEVSFGEGRATKCVGFYYLSSSGPFGGGGAWTKEQLGTITNDNAGRGASGAVRIHINDIYISGQNLLIVSFKNTATSGESLSCGITWEVW